MMVVSDGHEMNGLATRLRNYVQSVLHVRFELTPWNQSERLPVFLSKRFEFLYGPILSIPCVFVLVPPDSDMTPSEFEKRRDHLQNLTDDVIVFVFDHMASYNRARLIDRAVSFAVPYNQLYVPPIAIDLREHFRARTVHAETNLSPSAQVVLFRHLLVPEHGDWTPSQLAEDLRYSAMTIGRAFEELSSLRLGRTVARGRSKYLLFEAGPSEIFQNARNLLRSPVTGTYYFKTRPLPKGFFGSWIPEHLPRGGLAALSERTMITSPDLRHFAVGPTGWKVLQADRNNTQVRHAEDAHFGVDVWRYDPDIVTGEAQADPLSLYVQFHDDPDERVAGAASQLMEQFSWFLE